MPKYLFLSENENTEFISEFIYKFFVESQLFLFCIEKSCNYRTKQIEIKCHEKSKQFWEFQASFPNARDFNKWDITDYYNFDQQRKINSLRHFPCSKQHFFLLTMFNEKMIEKTVIVWFFCHRTEKGLKIILFHPYPCTFYFPLTMSLSKNKKSTTKVSIFIWATSCDNALDSWLFWIN